MQTGTPTPEPCVFPFRYKGRQYFDCTPEQDPNNIPWCSVEVDYQFKYGSEPNLNHRCHVQVDSQGNHIGGGKRRWGHCDVEACREKDEADSRKSSNFDENDRMCYTVGK